MNAPKVDVLAWFDGLVAGSEAMDRASGIGPSSQTASARQTRAAVAKLMEVVQSIADDCRRGAHEHGMTPAGVQDIAARCDAVLANIGPQS